MSTPEHGEFVELFKASGWSQSELARQLYTTQATVSRYLSGVVPVPASAVRLLKLTLASENPDALQPAGSGVQYPPRENELGELRDKLEDIKRADPQAFKAAKLVIGTMHREATSAHGLTKADQQNKPETVRPKPDPLKAAATTGDALIGAKLAGAALGLKPKAAATTYKNAAPARPAPPAKGAPKVPPAPVPVEREP